MAPAAREKVPPRHGAPSKVAQTASGREALREESGDPADRRSLGAALLETLRQPMILIDRELRIRYRNRSGAALLARQDLVFEREGALACHDEEGARNLALAMRELALATLAPHHLTTLRGHRKSFRLRRRDGRHVAATVLSLRRGASKRAAGVHPVLFTVFEPGARIDVDPFVLSTTFDLTTAEARLASKLVNGLSREECARELDVKLSTVRSQLVSIYAKTGATGQADLVRLILSATSL